MTISTLDPDDLDGSVRPQDDLFRHANGVWLKDARIPEDRALTGSFTALRDASEEAVRDIIEDAAREAADGSPQDVGAKLGTLYADFMDTAGIEAAGIAPVLPLLERVRSVTTIGDLVELSAGLSRSGVQGLVAPYVSNDAGNPDRYLLHLYQSGLGLPDESYYREEGFAETREQYRLLLATLFGLADTTDPEGSAQRVLDLETRLAASSMGSVERRDPQRTYNLVPFDGVAELSGHLVPWLRVVTDETDQCAEVIVSQPDFVRGLDAALGEEELATWQEWLVSRILLDASDYLDDRFVNAAFTFYGTHLAGTPRLKDRWKRGVALVEGAMGEAIGQRYVERHFPATHKEAMLELVGNLISAYGSSITELTWMTDATRERALEKLRRFTTKIGYPDTWIDYGPLDVRASDLYGNVLRANEFEHSRQLGKLGRPIDRGAWLMTPQTVNAYYMPTMNEIVFPAAILQPPFFDIEADDAVNYGAIGAVIGHEIGHGFDDKGSQFDGTGRLSDWWSEADRTAFDALTGRLVAQYAALEPSEVPGRTVNGELTLGENIGDLGGLGISYRAYLLSLGGAEAPVIDGLTGTQRFLLSWATCWQQKIRPEEALRRLTVDPHSPNEFRCNQVVRNLDEFHEAFGVEEGDALWLAPEERVRIW
ncbi:peptidase M13 [Arthrobacter sp. RIT-PI-e]|uniref:M13 family metallopeptidase n=1 Tax=Arthrobacter sp. RIT-PI-e TaxID=1681197 RepID=UPI000675DCBD|nr:M13-type metalloendopeptidase [Arthrobacter sp. RIT-PI-e]KNC17800.1 peptidase M13 [Arthrobacter sp. RIT-PI-e]